MDAKTSRTSWDAVLSPLWNAMEEINPHGFNYVPKSPKVI
jgi:hypothetical protein